jgi:hypothetical protein
MTTLAIFLHKHLTCYQQRTSGFKKYIKGKIEAVQPRRSGGTIGPLTIQASFDLKEI